MVVQAEAHAHRLIQGELPRDLLNQLRQVTTLRDLGRLLEEELQILQGAQRTGDALAKLVGVGAGWSSREVGPHPLIQKAPDPL